MSGDSDAKELKRCIQNIIDSVNESISKIESSEATNSDKSIRNSILNNDNDTFTLNEEDNELMDELKTKIENFLDECFGHLSKICQKYLFNFLCQYEYDSELKQFQNVFSRSILPSFQLDLQGVLASVDAFPAAWDGNLSIVKDFISNYPSFKDKPGLWGTTLLYSASRNNKINVVKYLIEIAKCSVNAQNEQHLEKILLKSTKKAAKVHIEAIPSAASTALHGACFNGHLDIVKYLIDHGADYFIRNQADETPIMNAKHYPEIVNFFRNYLVLGYSTNLDVLPNNIIMENTEERQVDCIWEYKPFDTDKWYPFSAVESDELQKSLIPNCDQQFKHEIFLRLRTTVYSVSTIQFLRSGRGVDKENNLAWVRCRGSSILNFDCYSLWQIMFIKHPLSQSNSSPSLKIYNIPTIYNNQFKIQLNSWYNCNAKTNSQLDEAINYRKKIIHLDLDFLSDDPLIFDLQTFSFNNKQSTIQGFIRWIPKLISNNQQNKHIIKSIDNFSTLTNLDPIPLTTKHLQQFAQVTHTISSNDRDLIEDENENEDDYTSLNTFNSIEDDQQTDKVGFISSFFKNRIKF